MEKLRLRKEVKEVLFLLGLGLIFGTMIVVGINRFESINNGEMTIVSESQMAERN